MSDYTALQSVSLTLKALLEQHITNTSELQLTTVPIDLRSPKEIRAKKIPRAVSLWLYRVVRNGDVLNHPPGRVSPTQLLRRPMPLDLYYLVTPLAPKTEDEQVLLGRVLQVFNDHSVLKGVDFPPNQVADLPSELRVTLEALTLEELTRIWHALQESYELSVTYHVQLVTIASHHDPVQSAPVVVRETEYDQILALK